MDENEEILHINKEDLQEMSVDELLDLKIELDDMLREVEELISQCDDIIDEEEEEV